MTELWTGLTWREPLALLLALVPWLVWAWRRRAPDDRLGRYAAPHLWPWVLIGTPRGRRSMAAATAWALAALAAAGPQWHSPTQTQQERRGIDIVVVVDISPSMLVQDVAPSRLARTKRELHDFIAYLGGDRLGLVTFSANAYETLPLTHDRQAFTHFVDALEPGLASKTGSDLRRALTVAAHVLDGTGHDGKAIVLLSDGEHHGPALDTTAARLRDSDIPVYALGIGTPAGGPIPTPQGQFLKQEGEIVVSRLERERLESLAGTSGGAYTGLRGSDRDWTALLEAMRDGVTENHYSITTAEPAQPLYPWFLAASLALFLWTASPRPRYALIVAGLILPGVSPSPAHAWPWQDQAALEALQQGRYEQAAAIYHEMDTYTGHLGAGAAAYRLQDFATAAAEFERALDRATTDKQRARASYNLGNAYARMERLAQAGSAYERALAWRPNYAKAALNLTLVNQSRRSRRAGMNRDEDARHSRAGGPAAATAPSAAGNRASPTQGTRNPRAAQRQDSAASPVVQEPRTTTQEWRLDPGALDADLSAALQQLKSLQARPNPLLRFRFTEQDVDDGILPAERPW